MSGGQQFLPGYPAFVNELAGTLSVHAQYVLHGNIRDLYLIGEPGNARRPVSMLPLLWTALQPSGYQSLICYDPVDGISAYPPETERAAADVLGGRAIGRRPSLERLRAHLAKVVGVPEQTPLDGGAAAGNDHGTTTPAPVTAAPRARAAFVIDFAARITREPGHLDEDERDFFLYCQKLALVAKPVRFEGRRPGPLFNPVIWLVEGERDLPAWLTAGVEPIRTIAVGTPTLGDRTDVARGLTRAFPPSTAATDDNVVESFARGTDGMTLRSMMEVTKLAKDRGFGSDRVGDAIRIYKLGVDDDPWRRNSVRDQIIRGEQSIRDRIQGQERAVGKTLDILKRAALGLSGAQATSTASRPRGVLFFAGPTGTGKTEMAKQVAEILFGDTSAYLRFDMSEFRADHAADRLVGAPPGYVGFEAGGELTGAVRRKPFQVILFDEIEKANPKILDKFLQILEDGRLTDGQGITTHFSGCVLIFTSNLGIVDPDTREYLVTKEMEYPDIEKRVKAEIRDYFTLKIGRPELLNRLGDNIVVFDFIREKIADGIFDLQLANVIARVQAELGITVDLTHWAKDELRTACTVDRDNGGRGIGNQLESSLINPLARFMFDQNCTAGSVVEVSRIVPGSLHDAPAVEAAVIKPGIR